MAETLQLRVSEDRYTKTLDDLQKKIDALKNLKDRLDGAGTTLERAYKGNEVKSLLKTVKNYSQRTQDAMQDVAKKRQAILDHLESQRNVSSQAATAYDAELRKSEQPFA